MDAAQTEKLRALARDLVDEEGENRAVRTFLMQYSCDRSVTVGAMLAHMNMSGWRGTAPDFALNVRPETHLTKAGAQLWLRHLFSLECSAPAAGTGKDAERYRWLRNEARSVDWSRRFRLGTTPAYTYCCRHSPEQMDAEIDAAIAAHTKAREGA